jgi:hypothetical protein
MPSPFSVRRWWVSMEASGHTSEFFLSIEVPLHVRVEKSQSTPKTEWIRWHRVDLATFGLRRRRIVTCQIVVFCQSFHYCSPLLLMFIKSSRLVLLFLFKIQQMASPNLSSTRACASTSVGSVAWQPVYNKAALWDHVIILERSKVYGENTLWRCKYFLLQKLINYTRVEVYLLQNFEKDKSTCPKITYEMLSKTRKEVEMCKTTSENRDATHCILLHYTLFTQ